MRDRIIALSVTGALLFSGIASALAARTPANIGGGVGNARTPTAADILELRVSIASLRNRVSGLEAELSAMRSASAEPVKGVKAPFMVNDENDKPIFWVLNDHSIAMFSPKGRLVVGPGQAGNYGMSISDDSGKAAVQIGALNEGKGIVQVNKSRKIAASLSVNGLLTWNAAGKEIAHLGPEPTNKDRAELTVRGVFSILDANFNTVIDGGTLPDGRGAIRTWPNQDCRTFAGLRPPTCLMGVTP
jgi:hypothetical protein